LNLCKSSVNNLFLGIALSIQSRNEEKLERLHEEKKQLEERNDELEKKIQSQEVNRQEILLSKVCEEVLLHAIILKIARLPI